MPYAACAALGVAGVVGFKLLRGMSAPFDPAPDRPGEVVREVKAIQVPSLQPPLPPAAEAARPASPVVPSAALRPGTAEFARKPLAGFIDDTRQYAASFQPGVSLAGPIPEFANKYYFPTKEDEAPAVENYYAYASEAADSWSTDMELQLQNFFEKQPESARARLTITCRPSQCMMHMTEIGVAPGHEVDPVTSPANVMLGALKRQTWFSRQFAGVTTVASTPWVGEAHYQGMLLVRRKP